MDKEATKAWLDIKEMTRNKDKNSEEDGTRNQ